MSSVAPKSPAPSRDMGTIATIVVVLALVALAYHDGQPPKVPVPRPAPVIRPTPKPKPTPQPPAPGPRR